MVKIKNKFRFGWSSQSKLETCHKDLQLVMAESLKVSFIDFGVSEGHRSAERQQELFKQNKTKIDGVNLFGKHNNYPSKAADIYPFINGKADYSFNALCYLAGVIQGVAGRLLEDWTITHYIRWGGNWDNDGVILTDQRFDDLPHFELVKAEGCF